MPRNPKDFSKTCFYEIVCRNPNVKDIYIGSTVDFNNRKHIHKFDCNREKTNHLKLYTVINENGGWDNWEMKKIEDFPCETYLDIRKREQYWINEKKPSLNKNKAIILKKNEALVLLDTLSAQDRNREQSKWRNQSIKLELEELEKTREENAELKKKMIDYDRLKEENESLRNLARLYLNKS
jgi:hypothetical protein